MYGLLAYAKNEGAMARPKIQRRIGCRPAYSCFKPNGVPMSQLTSIELAADELEAMRLVDMNGLSQIEAAKQLGVSRQTLGNIVSRARQKVAQALVTGQAIDLQAAHLHETTQKEATVPLKPACSASSSLIHQPCAEAEIKEH